MICMTNKFYQINENSSKVKSQKREKKEKEKLSLFESYTGDECMVCMQVLILEWVSEFILNFPFPIVWSCSIPDFDLKRTLYFLQPC